MMQQHRGKWIKNSIYWPTTEKHIHALNVEENQMGNLKGSVQHKYIREAKMQLRDYHEREAARVASLSW